MCRNSLILTPYTGSSKFPHEPLQENLKLKMNCCNSPEMLGDFKVVPLILIDIPSLYLT